jgi:hypothetical protein
MGAVVVGSTIVMPTCCCLAAPSIEYDQELFAKHRHEKDIKKEVDCVARVQQIIHNHVYKASVGLCLQIVPQKCMYNDTWRCQQHERERYKYQYERHAILTSCAHLGLELAFDFDFVDDERVANEHDDKRYCIIDDQMGRFPFRKYVVGVLVAFIANHFVDQLVASHCSTHGFRSIGSVT